MSAAAGLRLVWIHQPVLKEKWPQTNSFYSGFGWPIAMLKYSIDDIRHFYQNDLRFLSQFKEVTELIMIIRMAVII